MNAAADPLSLHGRTAVVTGASSGLGARFLDRTRPSGATVFAAARRLDWLEELADADPHVHPVGCDVARDEDRVRLAETVLTATGRFDVLVNNTGAPGAVRAEDESADDFAAVLAVNLVAPFHLARLMAEAGAPADHARSVVNVSSVLGLVSGAPLGGASYTEAGNAVDLAMATGLLEAARTCEGSHRVRAVLLTGRGGPSASGATCGSSCRCPATGWPRTSVRSRTRCTARCGCSPGWTRRWWRPGAASVRSAAAVSPRPAPAASAYTGIGYPPDAGVSWSLPRLVGAKRALDLLLTNRRITAPEAAEMGLVSRVVADGRLAEEAEAAAAALARGATGAFGATRRLVAAGLSASLDAHLDAEARHLADAAVSAEGREGVAAFLARRSPDYVSAQTVPVPPPRWPGPRLNS